jgi:selenocysteine-specific elongation factor
MIVATAGHVDHGKTLLIKALTGVDTDRLPEEKRRQLTIDLGFAYLPLEGAETIGFIDVPGHERFIRNMLCGVAGIDFVLFIVAADDGPMPQTEEHLAILDLLGVSRGAVALTKIDRVPEERAAGVAEEIEVLFAGTSLEDSPVFPVSALTGDGIAALKSHLVETGARLPPRPTAGNFRLAIDRSFDIVGAGLVVTGTAFSGRIGVGDAARVLGAGMDVRIRGIHAQNAQAEAGRAGQRCALNLAGTGLDKSLVKRGDWIVAGNVPEPVRKIDVDLRVLAGEAKPLAHWTPVHVHLAARETTGRIALLGGEAIPPGSAGLVQIVLDEPVGAVHGDGLIVRDQSAQRTIGGGQVIDVFAPARGRARPERLAYLAAMRERDDASALSALLDAAPAGVDLDRFAAARNLTDADMEALVELVDMKTLPTAAGRLAFSEARWQAVRDAVIDALAAFHRANPDVVGPGDNRILSGTGVRLPPAAGPAVAAELVREGAIVKEGMGLRLPGHKPRLQGTDAVLWKKIQPLLAEGGLRPPVLAEIAEAVGAEPRRVESLLVRAGRHGLVVRVAKNRFFPPAALRRLAEIAEEVGKDADGGSVTAAAFRDASDIGRNLAIEVLEFFDKTKFTRRAGDAHVVIRPAAEAFGAGETATC